ncbi:MAG: hypothetical protein IKT99_07130, partial [Oscillospiraceae bacterium]|nr:hypothetical protein [Oscillospiraceae bacterium]
MGLILCLTAVLAVPPAGDVQIPAVTVQAAAPARESASFDAQTELRLRTEGEVRTLSLHDYLIGVVMSELPASFEDEALRAQAIASRTFAL